MSVKNIFVFKFGGSSMSNRDAISRVMEIVGSNRSRNRHLVTVVSAMAGVTDALHEVGLDGLHGRTGKVESALQRLRSLHAENFEDLAGSAGTRRWINRFLDGNFAEIRRIVQGITLLREFSSRTRDRLLAFGEILSSNLLASVLKSVHASFCHSDSRDWIVADWTRQGAVVDFSETEKRVCSRLLPLLERNLSPVTPGFICRTKDGETATLGRNGSDYSASIVGAALRAREIWIYSDVDGIMTADPNLVAEAAILPRISYQEAAEMSFFGAKVLHPKTMTPAVLKRIPVRIKNTFNPNAPGTLITDRSVRRPLVKTVTSVRDLSLVNLQGNGMIGIPRVPSRLFEVLARENINVLMISQSSSEYSICMVIQTHDAERAVLALRREFQLEIDRHLIEKIDLKPKVAIVSIIGDGMRGTPGTSGKFFDALGKCRINVLAIAQGSSELNITAAIWEKDYRHAVQAIHSAFGLTRDLHVFVFGCGNIGRTLLRQINEGRKQIAKSLQINLKVLGVANSKSWCFSAGGLSGSVLESLGSGASLEQIPSYEPRPTSPEIFNRIAGTYRSDVVLVDATGADLASVHIEGLRRGFHVVTANKKPLASKLTDYLEIQRLSKRKGLNYQYEATFGAGLPLLSTLQDLINTGDRVLRIQGCLSGTLGFICSRLDEGVPFSRAVAEAKRLGYAEPDPRDDLSGVDVARKSLIITRELGIHVEPKLIRLKAMIPKSYFRLNSVEEFLERLPAIDAEMKQAVRAAHTQGMVLRYMADISEGRYIVGLKRVPRESPIGRLSGPDNILVFKTDRYFDHPLVIQGPGAGAGVTAAGVLGDILKIAKWI